MSSDGGHASPSRASASGCECRRVWRHSTDGTFDLAAIRVDWQSRRMDETRDERPPTRQLDESECWQRIASAPYGRIAAGAAGQIDIFPVNHAVANGTIVFRTAPGTKLLELTIHDRVVFEVDGADEAEAFSVVVKGDAEEFDRQGEVFAAEALGIVPWAPEEKDRWVRIIPAEISGRAFQRAQGV